MSVLLIYLDKRSQTTMLLARRTSNILLNNNKVIVAKRNHLSLLLALAFNVHKSQGDSFRQVVFINTAIDICIFIMSHERQWFYTVIKGDNSKFYHNRKPNLVTYL